VAMIAVSRPMGRGAAASRQDWRSAEAPTPTSIRTLRLLTESRQGELAARRASGSRARGMSERLERRRAKVATHGAYRAFLAEAYEREAMVRRKSASVSRPSRWDRDARCRRHRRRLGVRSGASGSARVCSREPRGRRPPCTIRASVARGSSCRAETRRAEARAPTATPQQGRAGLCTALARWGAGREERGARDRGRRRLTGAIFVCAARRPGTPLSLRPAPTLGAALRPCRLRGRCEAQARALCDSLRDQSRSCVPGPAA